MSKKLTAVLALVALVLVYKFAIQDSA